MHLTVPKLLIVDNDHQVRRQVQQQLKDKFLVFGAENGLEALDLIRNESGFDLLLIDMVMPLMDGVELIREVRQITGYRSVPIIMMSKLLDLPTRRRALESGAVCILQKPLDPFELEFQMRNISDLSLKLRALTRNAHTDPYTGLPDPVAAADNVKNEYDRCRRASLTLAIVKFKIDCFAELRLVLPKKAETTERLVAAFLLSAFQRPNDRLGYLGEGEFILSTAEHALNPLRIYLESLRNSLFELQIPHVANDPYKYVTISTGAALGHPQRGENRLELFLSLADGCLAEAAVTKNSLVCKGVH